MTSRHRVNDHGMADGDVLKDCRAVDLMALPSSRQRTPEGYLIAPATIARTGIQLYRAKELGLDAKGVPPHKIFRAYRPTDEVFNPDAMSSFESKPVADDHPPEDITSENWEKYAVGDLRDVSAAGKQLAANVIVRKQSAIDKVNAGKAELSCGYVFDADFTPGTAPDGSPYDFVQRKIRGNHVAIVDMGRAGPGVRIADRQITEERPMSMIKIRLFDGITVNVAEEDAQRVTDAYDRHAKSMTDMKSACDDAKDAYDAMTKERDLHKERADAAESKLGKATETAEKDKKAASDGIAAKDAEIADLKAKTLTPEQIEEKVSQRAEDRSEAVIGAKKLVGDSIKTKGKTASAIRTEVLTHVVANDAGLKAIVEAGLRGVALDKADENKVSDLFAVAIAAKTATARDGADDPEIGRVLAHDDGNGNGARATRTDDGGESQMTAKEILIFRDGHGGMSPSEWTKRASA